MSSIHGSLTHPLIQTYEIVGRLISVAANSTLASELFGNQLSGWHFKRADHNRKPDATIQVSDGNPPALPDNLDSFELPASGRCYTDWVAYHIVYDDSLVTIGRDEAAAVQAWMRGGLASQTTEARARLVSNTVAGALRRCGLYDLHGACVIEPVSGKGVLFIGPSGSAKSTFAAQLANSGWGYLSDDSLLLYTEQAAARVQALRRAFSVTTETVYAGGVGRFIPVLDRQACLDPSKQTFDPGDVVPDAFAESNAPSLIIFPNLSDRSRTQSHPLSSQEAMSILIRQCPWASFDRIAAPGYLRALSHLARSCAAYRLDVGTDLFGDAAATARFIEALL